MLGTPAARMMAACFTVGAYAVGTSSVLADSVHPIAIGVAQALANATASGVSIAAAAADINDTSSVSALTATAISQNGTTVTNGTSGPTGVPTLGKPFALPCETGCTIHELGKPPQLL